MSEQHNSFIKIPPLSRKKGTSHGTVTTKASRTQQSVSKKPHNNETLTEQSPLVVVAPEPTNRVQDHYTNLINTGNMIDRVRTRITLLVENARRENQPTFVAYAFTVVGTTGTTVNDTVAFVNDKANIELLGNGAKATTMLQFRTDTRQLYGIQREAIAVMELIKEIDPSVDIILEKRFFKKSNTDESWLSRLRTPALFGIYYVIVGDRELAKCRDLLVTS
jgi:hypothetical protein